MTGCPTCGLGTDEELRTQVSASWDFFIDRQPPSLNDHIVNAGKRRWAYAAERDTWIEEIWAARVQNRIPPAAGKRRLIVTRHYKGRQRERDYVNLVGGCKALVDALVSEGLLVDDDPKRLEDHYRQVRSERDGVEIYLGELP